MTTAKDRRAREHEDVRAPGLDDERAATVALGRVVPAAMPSAGRQVPLRPTLQSSGPRSGPPVVPSPRGASSIPVPAATSPGAWRAAPSGLSGPPGPATPSGPFTTPRPGAPLASGLPSTPFPTRPGGPGAPPSGPHPAPPAATPIPAVTPPASPGALGTLLERTRRWASRPTTRRSLIGVAWLLQAGVLVAGGAYWLGSVPSTDPTVASAPVGWVGVVHDVGAAGVNLRSAPQVLPTTSRTTAARGSQLRIVCGLTGDAVGQGTARTATWLRTADGLYVSLLYIHVDGKQNIATCADGQQTPLLSLGDPNAAVRSPGSNSVGSGSARAGTGNGSNGDSHSGDDGNDPRSGNEGDADDGSAGQHNGTPPASSVPNTPNTPTQQGNPGGPTTGTSTDTPTSSPSASSPGSPSGGTEHHVEHLNVDPNVTPLG